MPTTRYAITLVIASLLLAPGCQIAGGPAGEQATQLTSTAALEAAVSGLTANDILTVDQLKPGMKGYGLTVFAGAKPEKFDVEIVSVLRNYDPKADMILIRCAGHGLEKSGIAAGMSGSPIYIEGKLIGALAYGWSFTVEPIAGVQPIEQMLCNSGMSCELPPATQCDNGICQGRRDDRIGGSENLAGVFSRKQSADGGAAPPAGRGSSAGGRSVGPVEPTRLRPLAVPLSVSGCSNGAMQFLGEQLKDSGIVPLRSGGSGSGDPRMADARIEPGSTLTIPLMTGDMDVSALGTVTAVVKDRVLAFGHPMYAEGPVNIPMAVGIVHTFIPSMYSSFKMGSAGPIVGAVRRDENASILGVFGHKPEMTQMTVRVSDWTGAVAREYNYQIADEWYFGPMLAAVGAISSAESEHGAPIERTVYYSGQIRFRGFEPYKFSGVSAGSWATYDLAVRIMTPIRRMLNNSWGKGFVESIDLDIRTINENRQANLEQARLQETRLAPGEPAILHFTLERYKKPRLEQTIKIDLPADLPDGTYQLALLDAEDYRYQMSDHDPRTFQPENMAEMVGAFNKLAVPRDDHFYVALTLPRGGLVARDQRLPALPPSRAMILRQAGRESFDTFVQDRVWPQEMDDMVVYGSRRFTVTIDRNKGRK